MMRFVITLDDLPVIIFMAVLIIIWVVGFACKIADLWRNRRKKNRRKNMSNHNEQLLRDAFRKGLEKQHKNGLLQGATAICGVVIDIARDTKLTPDERIEKIIAFCSVSLNAKNRKNDQTEDGNKNEI